MPDGFTKITQEQAESCPDGDGVVKALETALQSIGVKKVSDCYWGNYKTAGSVVDMEAYLITDAQNLIVRCQYLNNSWTVVYITDSENGHLYYPTTGKDAYNLSLIHIWESAFEKKNRTACHFVTHIVRHAIGRNEKRVS